MSQEKDIVLRDKFYRTAATEYKVSEECLKTMYIFIGSDGDGQTDGAAFRYGRLRSYLKTHCDLSLPGKREYCLCGNAIMENCYLVNKDTVYPVLVSGNCCMRAFLPQDSLKKHCERCGKAHQNKKDNLCTECRQFCIICDEPHKNKHHSLCKKHEQKIVKTWDTVTCLITLKRVHKAAYRAKFYKITDCLSKNSVRRGKFYTYTAFLGDSSTVFQDILPYFDKLSVNLKWYSLHFEPEDVNHIRFITNQILQPGVCYKLTQLQLAIYESQTWFRDTTQVWTFDQIQATSPVTDASLLSLHAHMAEKAMLSEKRRAAAQERKKRKQAVLEQESAQPLKKACVDV